jgi:hypothetical protein
MSHHIHHHHVHHRVDETERANLPGDTGNVPPVSKWLDELFASSANQNAREECKATSFHMTGRSLVESLNIEPLEGCGGHGAPSPGKQGNAAAESNSNNKGQATESTSNNKGTQATESHAPANKGTANANANAGQHGGQAAGHGCGHGGKG